MLDFIRFAIALLPLAAYTNVLGLLRLRTHPTVLSGSTDLVLLGLGVIGCVAIGPMELFFPRAAYSLLGMWVWIVLIALYFFVLMLIALNLTPKIIVYGLEQSDLRVHVCELIGQNRLQASWMGDVVELPELGVRACIETAGKSCISQLNAAGSKQNLGGWLTLERLLVAQVKSVQTHQRSQAIPWLIISLLLFGSAAVLVRNDLPRLHQAMSNIFERD